MEMRGRRGFHWTRFWRLRIGAAFINYRSLQVIV
jgi:hypothetical protein